MKTTDREKHIQTLIDRFMAGNSNVDEERMLGEFFKTHEVKPEWRAYKEMFAYFDNGMAEPDAKDSSTDVAVTRQMRKRLFAIAAAAVAAILIVMTFTINRNGLTSTKDTVLSKNEKTTVKRIIAGNASEGDITENSATAQVAAYKKKTAYKMGRSKAGSIDAPSDSNVIKKIDNDIAATNNILTAAQNEADKYIDDTEHNLRTSNNVIKVVYASYRQQHEGFIIRPVLEPPSESLDLAVASSAVNITYK